MSDIVKFKVPTLQELTEETPESIKENALTVILNQPPPKEWIKQHPFVKIEDEKKNKIPLPYIPIERVEYLLTRIFGKWWVEVKNISCIANSVTVSVRLYVVNQITKETLWNDGVGASPIQTESGKGAMDWNYAKSAGVQMALPAAKTYAIKDAAECFGKIFGKDLTRKDVINYDSLLKNKTSLEELRELYESKKTLLSEDENIDALRVINNNEINSFNKLKTFLNSKIEKI